MRNKIILTISALILAMGVNAQDIHFTQFYASPLTVNPALTGNFHGLWRVNSIYRNQWGSVSTPFVTFGASWDGAISRDLTHDDFLAGGIELYNDKSGQGNLTNFSALGSLAYHKLLGSEGRSSISVGLQGGYHSKTIDLYKLYFSDEFRNNGWDIGSGGHNYTPSVHYATVNIGLTFSQAVGKKANGIQFGVGANNLNEPKESFNNKQTQDVGLARRYTGQLGGVFDLSSNFSLKPAFLFQYQSKAMELIGGLELNLKVGGDKEISSVATALFLGGYYRYEDAIMFTTGVQSRGLRIGVGYDYNISKLNVASGGFGSWEIALQYIKPDPMDFSKRIVFPCQRF